MNRNRNLPTRFFKRPWARVVPSFLIPFTEGTAPGPGQWEEPTGPAVRERVATFEKCRPRAPRGGGKGGRTRRTDARYTEAPLSAACPDLTPLPLGRLKWPLGLFGLTLAHGPTALGIGGGEVASGVQTPRDGSAQSLSQVWFEVLTYLRHNALKQSV